MRVQEDTDTEGSEEDIETVLEEAAEDVFSQIVTILKRKLQTTCLTILKSLLLLSVEALALRKPVSSLLSLCTNRPTKPHKGFPVHKPIQCAVFDD